LAYRTSRRTKKLENEQSKKGEAKIKRHSKPKGEEVEEKAN
jgi:hypothetical protein